MGSAGAAPAPVDPFSGATYDQAIHEDPSYDYLVAACSGDDQNAMTFNADGAPVTDLPVLLAALGGTDPNGCNENDSTTGLRLAGTDGETEAQDTGVKGAFTLTAPTGTTITGLSYSDPDFLIPDHEGIVSGWFGELPGNSDGQGLAADHDPTQTYDGFQAGDAPAHDCVQRTPSSYCQVDNSGTDTFVFNANPWTTSSNSQPALQALALGFECRAVDCAYSQTSTAGVTSAVMQLDDPGGAPATGQSSGGEASFDGHGVAAASGWQQASGLGATSFTTGADPAGICSLSAGLYDAAGNPVDVDDDGRLPAPALDQQNGYFTSASPCSTPGTAASTTYTPDASTLSALPSGTYYLNAVAQNPAEYQQGVYSWYAGGLTGSATAPAGSGIPVQIDNTAPTVTISGQQSGWSSGPQTVTVTGTTGPSGVAGLDCTDAGTAMTPATMTSAADSQTDSFTVSGNGAHALACTVTSGVGSTGAAQASVEIDSGQPQIAFSDSQQPSAAGWYSTAQQVQVTATEPDGLSGVARVTCSADKENYQTSESGGLQISVTGDGTHTITCQATTNAGVVGSAQTYTVKIDSEVPTVKITGPATGTYSSGSATLNVSAQESGPSGIAGAYCEQDGGTYTALTLQNDAASFAVTGASGSHTVNCYAVTNAGVSDAANPAAYTVALDDGDGVGSQLTKYGSSPLIDGGGDPYSEGPSQTAWYTGAQQVTVTAVKSAGAPITDITCTGAGVQENYPNTGSGSSEVATVSVQPPGGLLSCTATDSAANVFPLGSYEFQIDDTAPTGNFVGQDPQDLALVRVAATDSGSGVHSVEISFTCQSGPCLTAHNGGPFPIQSVPAAFQAGDGYWEADIPDTGTWPDGDYSLTATMTDVAGNTGTTGSFADSTAAGIALPARILTTITASITAGGQTALAQGVSATPGATQQLARGRQEAQHSLTLAYGSRATVNGVLLDRAGDIPMPHARIVIYARPSTGGSLTKIGSTTTNAAGQFRYRLSAGPSRSVFVTYDGSAVLHPAAVKLTERFRGMVRASATPTVRAGRELVLTGRVYGGHIPRGGILVQPRYLVSGLGGSWAPFGNAVRTNGAGVFHLHVRLAKVAAGLVYKLDVQVQSQAGWAYLTAISPMLTRKVLP